VPCRDMQRAGLLRSPRYADPPRARVCMGTFVSVDQLVDHIMRIIGP
jgi:hypothetical protein